MARNLIETANRGDIYQWEVDEMKTKTDTKLKQTDQVDDEAEFGGDNICISGNAASANFKKGGKEASEQEEDKNDISNSEVASMAIDEGASDVANLNFNSTSSIPWMTPRTQVNDPWIQLHNEMVEFYRLYGPSKAQNLIRKNLFMKVKRVIKKFFPGAVVKMFGSTAAMLYLPKSDIDIVVFLPKSQNDHKNARKLHKLINKISWVKSCECIGAKVPIVKLEDKEAGLFVDISFSRANGVAALSFIKKYLILYPELKYLLIIVKAFLKTRDLNETFHGGMSSFVCTLLIISYLQEIKKNEENHSLLLSEHLINFFHLYGVRFNYNELGISIRNGGAYFLREERDWMALHRNKSVTLCVENPQDSSIDLGKGVFNMPQIHTAFQHAYDTIRFNSSKSESLLECIMGDTSLLRIE